MPESKKSEVYYIPLGGTLANAGAIKYGFKTRKGNYDNIAAGLGAVKSADNTPGLTFGSNRPKPVTVIINYQYNDNEERSCRRFCEPDKLGAVITGSLNSLKVKVNGKEYQINHVTVSQ